MRYFLQRGEERFGPYSLEEVRHYLVQGNILETDWLEPEEGGSGGTVSEVLNRPVPPPLPPRPTGPPPVPATVVLPKPAYAQTAPGSAKSPTKKGKGCSTVAIVCGVLGMVVLSIGMLVVLGLGAWYMSEVQVADKPLLQDRRGHVTEWQDSEDFEGTGEVDVPPSDIFEVIKYPAPSGDLSAYLTPDPGDGKKHPAMVWAKGGFGGIGSFLWEEAYRTNDQSAAAFREAGIVLMCPSWRGENDNPGRFELFYGEVEDFLAAIKYAKSLPYVDPDRVYIGGHSTGGTITLLAAVSGADFRAAFAFGGEPDFYDTILDDPAFYDTPYPVSSVRDHELRSAIRYTPYIKRPTFYFEGQENFYYVLNAKKMEKLAKEYEVPFQSFTPPGDHFDILAPITELIAQKILEDEGNRSNIQFRREEIVAAWKGMHEMSLADELIAWLDAGGQGSVQPVLDKLGDASVPTTVRDIYALRSAIEQQSAQNGEALHNVSLLATLGFDITDEDEDLLLNYDKLVSPLLQDWARRLTQEKREFSEDEIYDWFELVDAVLYMGGPEAAEFAYEMVQTGFAADNYSDWSDAFSWIDTQSECYEELVEVFQPNPPYSEVGLALLERANRAFLDDEWEGGHPYDSTAGRDRLRKWIKGVSTGSYEAAITLAYVSPEIRAELLGEALKHPDVDVQLEAAWADLMHGGARGLKRLQQACLDPNYAETAKQYLEELGREGEIPPAALDPDYSAKAAMIEWLKYPNELGAPPATIEIYDSRELYWPPTEDRRQVWLFKFTYRWDESEAFSTGYGMYGSMTWSSFEEYETPPTAENLYAHHCALEIYHTEDLEEPPADSEALEMLSAQNPGMFAKK